MTGQREEPTSQPPAQRRRLAEGDFGEPDVILTSEDGTEYAAHSRYLQITCEVFDDMFQLAQSDAVGGVLPTIPLHETSAIVELVLPLAYRRSAASLRDQPFTILVACLKLAHRLGMPLVVDHLAIFLEAHVDDHAAEIYPLACNLGLDALEKRSKGPFSKTINISKPFDLAEIVGTYRARDLFTGSLIDHMQSFDGVNETHKRINRSRELSDACADEGCPGAICRDDFSRSNLQIGAILARHVDVLKRLDMLRGREIDLAKAYLDALNANQENYKLVGQHQKECPAFECIKSVMKDLERL